MPRRRPEDELLPLLLALRRRRLIRRSGGGHALRVVVLCTLVVILAAVGGAVVAGATAVQAALTDCTLAGRTPKRLPETSLVYAAHHTFLGAIPSPVYRQPVRLTKVSPWIMRTTVAAEDRTFWTNDGLDYASIARAALADLSSGRAVQGASTITQQLVRNLYLNDDKTFARKRLEACLALKLAKAEPKWQVLSQYLNRIPYGGHVLGIEAAARTYFGIHASQLGLDQAALLAGLPQAPSEYDPFAHPAAALARRNQVLHALHVNGVISLARYRTARRKPLGLHPGNYYTRIREPEFFDYVEAQLVGAFGKKRVAAGGLRVYTTLDPKQQQTALRTMGKSLGRRGDPAAALVSIDPRSGAVTALASSWHGHSFKYDLAADAARQTGSAFKPFVLIDAVWHHHADPNTTWYDSSKFTYRGWTPRTYENRYFGPETLLKATLLSDNVVYAKLTLDVGPANVARVAHRMGILSHLDVVPSIGLGSNSVTPLSLATAYATLASGGIYHRPFAIRKVVANGHFLRNRFMGKLPGRRVLPRGVAWTVTKVLEQNVQSGTGVAARMPGREVAGKTGTTENWTDAWFAGYTPGLATVTWVGYPRTESRPMTDVHGVQVQGATFPTWIWHAYMASVLRHTRPQHFPRASWPMWPYHGPRSMRTPASKPPRRG